MAITVNNADMILTTSGITSTSTVDSPISEATLPVESAVITSVSAQLLADEAASQIAEPAGYPEYPVGTDAATQHYSSHNERSSIIEPTRNKETLYDYGYLSSYTLGDSEAGSIKTDRYGRVKFTPADGFVGTAIISYSYISADKETINGKIEINVKDYVPLEKYPIEDDGSVITIPAPAPNPGEYVELPSVKRYSTDSDRTSYLAPLRNDSDTGNAQLEKVEINNPSAGSVEIINNRIKFTPTEYYNGTATLEYYFNDDNNYRAKGTIEINVETRFAIGQGSTY